MDEWLDSKGTPDYSGSDLIADLQDGRVGVTNVGTPFAVATADRNWLDVAALQGRVGYLGTIYKAAALTETVVSLADRMIAVPGRQDLTAVRCAATTPATKSSPSRSRG